MALQLAGVGVELNVLKGKKAGKRSLRRLAMDGFVEVSQKEMMEVDGGVAPVIMFAVATAVIVVAQAINPQKAY